MPSTTQAVSRFPLDLSRSTARSSVLMLTLPFRHLNSGTLTLVFLIHTCRDLCPDFSLTLTTMALYQCSLRWFEACSCKPTSRGPPSSSVQLRTLYVKSALVAHLEKSQVFEPLIRKCYIAVNLYFFCLFFHEKRT